MWKFLEGYFTFTRWEKKSIIVLLALSVVVLLVPRIYLHFVPVEQADSSKYKAEIEAFTSEYNSKKGTALLPGDTTLVTGVQPVVNQYVKEQPGLFYFDPNTIGVPEWMKLGFSEKQALSIQKYKAKGGTFYKPVDLKRLYVMSDEHYLRLSPYVRIDTAAIHAARFANIKYFPFDPNTIGVDEWIRLGFSEKQAKSIEKYKATGAVFHKPEDLKKVYVIGEEGYERLKPYILIENR